MYLVECKCGNKKLLNQINFDNFKNIFSFPQKNNASEIYVIQIAKLVINNERGFIFMEIKSNKTNNIKDNTICFRCTNMEKTQLRKLAENSNISLGDYIIEKCLSAESAENIRLLCKLQTLLNQLRDGIIKKKEYIRKMEMVFEEMKWQ